MQGQDARALTEYREALRLKPDLPTAHLNIAVLLIKAGTPRGGADAPRRPRSSIDPGYEPARTLLERLPPP